MAHRGVDYGNVTTYGYSYEDVVLLQKKAEEGENFRVLRTLTQNQNTEQMTYLLCVLVAIPPDGVEDLIIFRVLAESDGQATRRKGWV